MREDLEGNAKFDVTISGKAQSKDRVVIIGEAKGTMDFTFHLNTDDPAKSWAQIKEMDVNFDAQDESTPERKLKKHIYMGC